MGTTIRSRILIMKVPIVFVIATVLVAIAKLQAEPSLPAGWPQWKSPGTFSGAAISNWNLEVTADAGNTREFELQIAGHRFACANLISTIVYRHDGTNHFTEIAPATGDVTRKSLNYTTTWSDADGATWTWKTSAKIHRDDVEINGSVEADRDREVMFLPLLTLFAGENSFGTSKEHALFSGVEYLDNEPSSSELDLAGPQSKRQIPPAHDLTLPLMAIQADDRYAGIIWEDARHCGGLFDTPDRIFGSKGHVMGVIWPATEGGGRDPGEVLPKSPAILKAKQPLQFHIWIVAGVGNSVVPAIQQCVRIAGLPKVPKPATSFSNYLAITEAGWLKSKIRVGDQYRHALSSGGFPPGPAIDAAVFETWLASRETKTDAKAELRTAATAALAQVNPTAYFHGGPGHIRTPAAALLFGHLPEAIKLAHDTAAAELAKFDSEGRVIYHPTPGGMDFGKGHFAPDANGYTAATLINALESAAFCGDRALIDQAVAMLRKQDHFHGSTPRGVQVWELALHTPDIMASAYLCRAYVDGYELTGDQHLLDEASHWAWTGVPFVYLRNPTAQIIGPYATIAVYGATHWQAPNWIGLPVQWCGLVYSDALYRLSEHEASPWRQIADGITWSGVQQSYPLSDSEDVGLLPDSFVLAAQRRNPPQINPATLGASALRYFTTNTIYDFRGLPESGLLVHAPCRIVIKQGVPHHAEVFLDAWETDPFYVLMNSLPGKPRVKVNNAPFDLAARGSFDAQRAQLILQLRGKSTLELDF